MKHPIPKGTKTNIGTIKNYKLVKYGVGKYRYTIEEDDKDYGEEDIELIDLWVENNTIDFKSFSHADEPIIIHIVKTGFINRYMVVWEDAHDLETGKVEFGTKIEIENKFNIKLK